MTPTAALVGRGASSTVWTVRVDPDARPAVAGLARRPAVVGFVFAGVSLTLIGLSSLLPRVRSWSPSETPDET